MNKLFKMKIQLFGVPGPKDEQGLPVPEVNPLEQQYLDQIADLKLKMDGMVEGAEYDRVLAQHKKLTEDYINRRPAPKKEEPKKETVEFYAKKLKENKFKSNRDFLETSLAYRDAYIGETGKDPWGDSGEITEHTKEVANHIKTILEENETASEFNFRLEQSLIDDPIMIQNLRAKK